MRTCCTRATRSSLRRRVVETSKTLRLLQLESSPVSHSPSAAARSRGRARSRASPWRARRQTRWRRRETRRSTLHTRFHPRIAHSMASASSRHAQNYAMESEWRRQVAGPQRRSSTCSAGAALHAKCATYWGRLAAGRAFAGGQGLGAVAKAVVNFSTTSRLKRRTVCSAPLTDCGYSCCRVADSALPVDSSSRYATCHWYDPFTTCREHPIEMRDSTLLRSGNRMLLAGWKFSPRGARNDVNTAGPVAFSCRRTARKAQAPPCCG